MCGRYALVNGKKVFLTWEKLQDLTRRGVPVDIPPRYNVAPSQRMPVVVVRDGELRVEMMRWGLVPHWSKAPKTEFSTINAKAETLSQSRLYAPYFQSARCLVPADAFYEWKRTTVEKVVRGKPLTVQEKHPMCIRMKDESPFMFAGLFSIWRSDTGEEVPTYTIITTTPNDLVAEIHNRMPVILEEKHFDQWLDREYHDTEKLQELLQPYSARKMIAYRVSKLVNSPSNDVPQCLEPVAA